MVGLDIRIIVRPYIAACIVRFIQSYQSRGINADYIQCINRKKHNIIIELIYLRNILFRPLINKAKDINISFYRATG